MSRPVVRSPGGRRARRANDPDPEAGANPAVVYQIRLEGHLGDQWQEWFGGLSITREDHGVTLLCGPVVDQAALHGLLKKVRDLGAPLISLRRVELGEAGADGTAHPAPIEAEDHRHSPKDPCP